MQAAHVLLFILGAALFTSVICSNGIGPDDCCFTFYPRKVKKSLIRSYRLTDYRCSRSGVILLTVRHQKRICVDPRLSWVQNITKTLAEAQF
ncbi:hypothetical protein LDENG_00109010 [Lucifuga dentata]|nr:hypothetical protein LDENG_00109010 [Lucifuga dentata]